MPRRTVDRVPLNTSEILVISRSAAQQGGSVSLDETASKLIRKAIARKAKKRAGRVRK